MFGLDYICGIPTAPITGKNLIINRQKYFSPSGAQGFEKNDAVPKNDTKKPFLENGN